MVWTLPLAALGLTVWKGRSLEAKRSGEALVTEIKLGDVEILGWSDLVMPPTDLVVTGAGLEGKIYLSLSQVGWRTMWVILVAIINNKINNYIGSVSLGSFPF